MTMVHRFDRKGDLVESVELDSPPEVAIADDLHNRADQALDGLRQIANSSGTLTTAQLSNAARVMARVCIVLVRLAIRRLDAAD